MLGLRGSGGTDGVTNVSLQAFTRLCDMIVFENRAEPKDSGRDHASSERPRWRHFVTVSDIAQAIGWLEANMGTEFTFTQGMKTLSNPLAAWSAKQGYGGLKKNPRGSTIPAKGKIRDYLRLVLASNH